MAGTTCAVSVWPLTGDRLERNKYLLDTAFLSDSVLVLGNEQKEVKVHRFLLETSSPVFHNDFQKSSSNRLVIQDVDPQIFILLIRHVYLGESGVKPEECIPLFSIASHYEIQDLVESCSKTLIEDITNENATTLFQQAMKFGDVDLTHYTLTYWCRNVKKIANSKDFLQLREECLCEILKQDDLRVSNELEIFNAVLRWGEAECGRQELDSNEPKNIRKVLHKVLELIRFPVMEAEEFTLNVAIRNLLEDQELISMFLFFNVSSEDRVRVPQGRFNAAPRNYLPALGSIVYSAPRLLTGEKYSNGMSLELEEILDFKANQAVALIGLTTFHGLTLTEWGFRKYDGKFYDVAELVISVENVANGNTLLRQVKKSFNLLESEIMFDTPVDLEANSWYSISAMLKGSPLHKPNGNVVTGPSTCQTICNVKCKEEGIIQNLCFEFRRADDEDLPIEHGIIQELLFKTYWSS